MYFRHPSYLMKSERVKARFDNVTFDLITGISDQLKMKIVVVKYEILVGSAETTTVITTEIRAT